MLFRSFPSHDKTPEKLEVTVPKGPREKDSTVTVDLKKEGIAFSRDTVMFMLYLMFKSNMVSRVNLKQMFKIINDPIPENVAKYLLEEAAKG